MRIFALGLVVWLGLTFPGLAAEPSTWVQWRGPHRDGSVGGDPWPSQLSKESLETNYRVELGPSYSGPIVSNDHVFVTETRNAETEVVRALKRSSGEEVWQSEWAGAMSVPFFAKANGDWIRSTPAFDGENLYVAGMKDVLVCLDAKSGEIKWRQSFMESLQTPLPKFGCVCSPLVDGDFVYIQAGAGLCKLDKQSGKIVWRAMTDAGGMMGSAFSSPTIAEIGGVRQLVVQTRAILAGVNLNDGEQIWSREIEAFRGMNILTPTIVNDEVFTSTYGGGSFLFKVDGSEVSDRWRNKVQGYMSSPVVVDGHAYLHLRNQRFACINLETGKEAWITKPYGKYWSMIAQGNRILALDERGDLLLINANPENFELVGQAKVSEESAWAHLAITGREIFVRDLKGLTSFTWKD